MLIVEYIRAGECLFFHADGTESRIATVVVGGNPSRAFADQSDGDGLNVSALVAIQRDNARNATSRNLNVRTSIPSRSIVQDTSINHQAKKRATQT